MIRFLALGVLAAGAILALNPKVVNTIFGDDDDATQDDTTKKATETLRKETILLLTDHVIASIREKFPDATLKSDRYIGVEKKEKKRLRSEIKDMTIAHFDWYGVNNDNFTADADLIARKILVDVDEVRPLEHLTNKYYSRIIGKMQVGADSV